MSEKEYLVEIGKKIVVARRGKGLSQFKLGKLCSLHESNLCYIETGRRGANILTLKRIADSLDMNVKDFL